MTKTNTAANAYDDLDNCEIEKPSYGGGRGEKLPYNQEFTIRRARVTQVVEKDGQQEHSDWKGFTVECTAEQVEGLKDGGTYTLFFQEPTEVLVGLRGKVKTKEAKAAIVKRSTYNFRSFAAACSGKSITDPKLKVLGVMRKLAEMTIGGELEAREIVFGVRCVQNGKYFNTEIGAAGEFELAGAKPSKPAKAAARPDPEADDEDDEPGW